jgi:predicted acyl esterase
MMVDLIFRKAKSIEDTTARYPGFNPARILLGRGSVLNAGALSLPCDILFEQDVAVPMRDGTKIYTDIFRPVGESNLAAIVAWSPYGKQGGTSRLDDIPDRYGVPKDASSGLEKWEGPDPAYWCARGYAIINPDARGAYMSEGNIHFWGNQEGRDGYDLIEWVAALEWCNGKVGLSGNSWLAIAQWFIAAERPPHLCAIAPWEGFTDFYRDASLRGGIADLAFLEKLVGEMSGNDGVEDVPAMARKYPLMNAYWQEKAARLEQIAIPAYIDASWTNGAHTPGTFGGYQRIASPNKWLRVHLSHEWPDYYSHQEDLQLFFDRYLKGMENVWEKTPPVRVSIYDPGGKDRVDRSENEFPLGSTAYTPLYLDAESMSLRREPVKTAASVRYNTDERGEAAFTVRFDQDTELTGYFKLRLWVQAGDSTDMDLFVLVQKLDGQGNVLAPASREPGFTGPHGRLRVSHRELDPDRSTPAQPYLTHTWEQLLTPGQIVPVEIGISPMGMFWHAGQQLRLIVAGYNPAALQFDWMVQPELRNKGEHILHMGGPYDSHLLVPMIPSKESNST